MPCVSATLMRAEKVCLRSPHALTGWGLSHVRKDANGPSARII